MYNSLYKQLNEFKYFTFIVKYDYWSYKKKRRLFVIFHLCQNHLNNKCTRNVLFFYSRVKNWLQFWIQDGWYHSVWPMREENILAEFMRNNSQYGSSMRSIRDFARQWMFSLRMNKQFYYEIMRIARINLRILWVI